MTSVICSRIDDWTMRFTDDLKYFIIFCYIIFYDLFYAQSHYYIFITMQSLFFCSRPILLGINGIAICFNHLPKVGNALVTDLVLRVSMGGSNSLPLGNTSACLPANQPKKDK